ncbi:BCCT family transporter [Halobacillus mangrovi]|uniref:Choline transporter n=1 Tax=Halobacillus mangrovi TaxID=402384 RepID=A0A1W5ZX00_9BACI|nr:BCCT family transporter [Halobacillus mangrovi]ARI77800.1 hypothetical protein HM131_13495 [Halobacillus mangrovi]
MKKTVIDWHFFIVTLLFLTVVCSSIFLFPETLYLWFDTIRIQINEAVGIVFLWAGMSALLFLLWVAFSSYGNIKLGKEQERPAFSSLSWIAMIFCAGIGSGIMYWGTIEWGFHMVDPPLGLAQNTASAIEWSAAYGMFHHGPTAWAIYTLPALPIAYIYHVKGQPILKISEACRPILRHYSDTWVGKGIDLFFVLGLLGASGTTLGISVPMMTAGVSQVTGIQESFQMNLMILMVCSLLFAGSVYVGLEKGIKTLSNINLYLILLFLSLIFILGPTVFIMEVSTNSIGLIANNFFRLNTWIDPIGKSGFPEKWTVFYWAWWIVYAPSIGLFIAKVSKGRTIQQMILGTIVFGPLGCWLFFSIIGNYGLFLQLSHVLNVTSFIQEGLPHQAIISIIHTLPLGGGMVALFTLLSMIFTATTYDTSSYIIAAVAQRSVDSDPERWNRLFWAFSLLLPPAALLFIGSLSTLQAVTILIAIPSCFILFLLSISFLKLMQERN